MSSRSYLAVVLVALAAFAAGLVFTRSADAQPKDERPAPAAAGRYQPVSLTEGDFAVVDTASGQAWRYKANFGSWSNLGIPAKEAK